MKVSELFYDLSVGEVSNLAMSDEGSGKIRTKDQGKLVVYLNDALTALHKRFVLRTAEVLIEPVDHITTYHLKKQFSLSSKSNEKVRYIIDTELSPFEGNVIRVLEVWDARGLQLPLNDPGKFSSVFTPYPDVLQVPEPINRNALSVIYQAGPRKIEYLGLSEAEVLDQDFTIPDFLLNALKNQIAYKIYTHMNGQEHVAKAQEYLTIYESECVEIENSDLVSQTQSTTQTKLESRGFI